MKVPKAMQSSPTSQESQIRSRCWAEAKMPSQRLEYRGAWQIDPQLWAAGFSPQPAQKGIALRNSRLFIRVLPLAEILSSPRSKLQGSFLLWQLLTQMSAHPGPAQLQCFCKSHWYQTAAVCVGPEVAVLWCLGCDAGGCANPLVNVRVLLHWGLDHVQAENFALSLQMICEFLHYDNFESAGFSV